MLDGVIGLDGDIGGASAGTAGRAAVPDAMVELNEPKSRSRSFETPVGEVLLEPALDEWLAALFGRRREPDGGGAKGGGSADTTGSRFAFTNCSSASAEVSSSASSLALGTISDKNSRSSEDSARELRGLPAALPRRENLLRKRDTAEGAAGTSAPFDTGSGEDEYEAAAGGTAAATTGVGWPV